MSTIDNGQKFENALILHQAGYVTFSNYEQILQQANELADNLANVVVTEESIKASKKLLAEVNKKVAELEDGRKAVKKELLAPYEEFERKIKEIVSVVKEADQIVRQQVKELEEQDRQIKQNEIANLFRRRAKLYPDLHMFTPIQFIKGQHLNKTTAMSKIEQELAEWFEKRQSDLKYIDSLEHAADIKVEYLESLDLLGSINLIAERNKVKASFTKETVIQDSVLIAINENDLKTVEALLNSVNIKYTIKG